MRKIRGESNEMELAPMRSRTIFKDLETSFHPDETRKM